MAALDEAHGAIVGVWRLVEYADRDDPSDPWVATFGTAPDGVILYHPTGLLAVQVSAAADDPSARFAYVAYFGTYVVREAHRDGDVLVGILEHRMEAAFPPELLDEGPDRSFTLEGDQLMLGDGETARRILNRVG